MTAGRSWSVAAAVLWLLCGLYAAQFVYRGWIAHDEGTIGQSAERVLAGEVPHRDFDEVYTGGLSYLHAASMKLFGVNLRAPRQLLFAAFMAFLAVVYAIGRRVASPFAGILAMALGAVWSVPNYFVSLPSWYNLFLAALGTWLLLRYLDGQRRWWLFAAGAVGGLSLLIKIAGLFYLAGGVLFLLYIELTTIPTGARRGRSGFLVIAIIPALVLAGLCLSLVGSVAPELLQLFAPALIVCLFLAWWEAARGWGGPGDRSRRLLALVWPFAAGAAVPLALAALAAWQQHALTDILQGTFVLAQRRLVEASSTPPAVATIALAAPYGLLLILGTRRPLRREPVVAAGVLAVLSVVVAFGGRPQFYQAIWAAARAMPLMAVAAGLWIVGRPLVPASADDPGPQGRARVFLLVAMAAMVALIQFPYATPIYFCYAAPMTILAIVAIVFAHPRAPRRVHLSVAAFFFLFAVAFLNRSYGWDMGVQFRPYQPASLLDLPRGGLYVPEDDRRTYEGVVRLVQRHAGGGTIFAGPDCPEVYFLSGFANPTRAFFDFLTPVREDESWMTALLGRAPIRAAVINTAPLFSRPLDPAVLQVLEQRFPSSERIGKFIVRFE